MILGLGRRKNLQMTKIGDREIILPTHAILGVWTEGDMIPQTQEFVLERSGKYKVWQNMVYEATTDRMKELLEDRIGPLADRPSYVIPKRFIKQPSGSPKDVPPAVSMVTHQAGHEELQKADTVVTEKGRTIEVRSTSLGEVNLSPKNNSHGIRTQFATKGDHEIE